ncbi:methyltransferase domain-containing protein [Daejeonella sp.]|uniref:class I SAM-dependent methyltransferase n=1 Tax=Daejeonella sp. TaxID=2805397 RepID=UPI0030BDD002
MKTFLKEAIKNIRQTGSVVESSAHLSEMMLSDISFGKNLQIVELGAGTGNMTKSLLNKMSPCSKLTSFEINPHLFDKLSKFDDDRLVNVNDTATKLSEYVMDQSVDYIISGLPLANINVTEKAGILDACIRILKPYGSYIQFQYSLNDLGLLKRTFAYVNCDFTLRNFPPAFVYYAQK